MSSESNHVTKEANAYRERTNVFRQTSVKHLAQQDIRNQQARGKPWQPTFGKITIEGGTLFLRHQSAHFRACTKDKMKPEEILGFQTGAANTAKSALCPIFVTIIISHGFRNVKPFPFPKPCFERGRRPEFHTVFPHYAHIRTKPCNPSFF